MWSPENGTNAFLHVSEWPVSLPLVFCPLPPGSFHLSKLFGFSSRFRNPGNVPTLELEEPFCYSQAYSNEAMSWTHIDILREHSLSVSLNSRASGLTRLSPRKRYKWGRGRERRWGEAHATLLGLTDPRDTGADQELHDHLS